MKPASKSGDAPAASRGDLGWSQGLRPDGGFVDLAIEILNRAIVREAKVDPRLGGEIAEGA